MKKSLSLSIFLLICFFGSAFAAPTALPTSLAPVLKKVMPAIVNISVQGELPALPMTSQDKPLGRKRGGLDSARPRKFRSIGSGVIVDAKKGYIITNAHVIRDGKTITVTVSDGRRLKAKRIGSDPQSDIAILKVKAKDLHNLPLGNSDKVEVGDFVVAIGNPFGLHQFGGTNQTATFGIVSALQRSDLNIEGVENFIQTDAAINPGNSGGALIDIQGRLIGINTAIISPYGGNIGIGFAIPINMARQIMQQIIQFGSVHRGLMGIYVQQLTPELADAFGISGAKGALVTQVNAGSPAAIAGLKNGDIILSINGKDITDGNQVKTMIGMLRVNSKIKIGVLRNGKKIELKAVITDAKKHKESQASKNPFLFGLALRSIEQQSPHHGLVKGVTIIGSTENSAARRAGLRPGDVIVAANQKTVANIQDLQKIADASKNQLLVHVIRGPGSLYFVIK